jgi:RNA polymerase sigma-70 factor (ECF subfamily)
VKGFQINAKGGIIMTDEKIVELYWERSEEAIKETDKQYGRYFHYIAKEILQDEEDAKEIVNDTYLKAWNSIPPERPNPLKAFLGRITRQLSLNRLEQNKAQKRGGGQYLLALDELAECIPDGSGSEDLASNIDLTDAINRFLRSLPIEQRRVFIKRYWYMSSITDTATSFGMSESKVTSILFRVRNKLKEHLTKEGFDL